jgi:hypothetical protein
MPLNREEPLTWEGTLHWRRSIVGNILPWILLLTVAGLTACARDEAHFALPHSRQAETVLVSGGARIDADARFLGPDAETAFWQTLSTTDRRSKIAAFLEAPLSAIRAPRYVEAGPSVYTLTAAGDRDGRICLAFLELYEGGAARVTARVSEDGGVRWREPEVVYHEHGAVPLLGPNSLVPGAAGEWYLLLRYRLGKVPTGLLFRVYRRQRGAWDLIGIVPGTDDLSTFDEASLAVSDDGRLAVAFVTYDGRLQVVESLDGGRSWASLGSPARLAVPGFRIPFLTREPRVDDGMPSLRAIADGWGLAWEQRVMIPAGFADFDQYADTLFAQHDRAAGRWRRSVRVNDRRAMVRTTMPLIQSGSTMDWLELRHRESRGTGSRYAHLTVAATGRLAILWTELRESRIVPVASISNDGGQSWSESIALDGAVGGDADHVRGSFDRAGNTLRAIYLTFPGQSSLRVPEGLGLKAAEVRLP